MTTHLKYDCMDAGMSYKENRHPQTVMEELGITYQHATPQSISDLWIFWNCENLPKKLPRYLTAIDLDPYKMIGYGLSEQDADKIAEYISPC